MSQPATSPAPPELTTSSRRGQSLVEFALVLPMLIVLLMGIADLGRVFTAGIAIEASARNAAEVAAQEYVQLARNKAGGTLDADDYVHLHTVAMDAVCEESEPLPEHATSGGTCTMPLAAVCVHDGVDPMCGIEADPSATSCPKLNAAWSNANLGAAPSGASALPHVEVRVCYRFQTLFHSIALPLGWGINLGEIYLERDREFTVANY